MLAEISVECTGSGHAQKLFASRFILVQCRVHAQLSVVPPTYLAIAALNLRIFPLHSSPFLVFLWYQHVPPPEVSVNTKLINIICNTSRIFAARTPTSRQNFDECSRMEVWCSEDMTNIDRSIGKVTSLTVLPTP